MTELSFSDITLDIEDLPSRAAALGEEQADDILGGYGFGRRMMRLRRRVRGRMRSRSRSRRRGSRGRPPRRQARRSPKRRSKRGNFMRKAKFHDRMAQRYRSMASRA